MESNDRNNVMDNLDKIPKTKKGFRMKQKIISAAKSAFSEYGYFSTRTVDITERAGISEGNFYRYFNNKDEVLRIVITDMLTQLYQASRSGDIEGSIYDKLVGSTKRMLKVYKENAGIFKVLLQVVHYDQEFYDLWTNMRTPFVIRIRKELNKVDLPEHLDKDYAASALGSMVSQFAYIWCVLGGEEMEKEFDFDEAAKTVASLWYRSIYYRDNRKC